MSVIKNKHTDIDFWSGQTIICNRKGGWVTRRSSDWSLILVFSGQGKILSASKTVNLFKGDLVLIAPGYPHHFKTDKDWNIIWFHFLMRSHISGEINWPEVSPGFYSVNISGRQFYRVFAALREAHQLDLQRSKDWYPLAYNLLESVLLRGNSQVEQNRKNAKDKIIKAQKLLLSPSGAINIDKIAVKCGMSRSAFYTQFKRTVGVSPREYRELHALRHAQMLLKRTQLPISKIADQVGMSNIYYFSNRFKKFSGLSPSAYRISKINSK